MDLLRLVIANISGSGHMRRCMTILSIVSGLMLGCVSDSGGAVSFDDNSQYPFPQHVDYAPGTIRPNHRTQEQQDEDVRSFYKYWKSRYLVKDGASSKEVPFYRVAFGGKLPAKAKTVSEGQGYGMMIVATMGGHDSEAQMIFNGLWNFVRDHPSEIDSRLMDWDVPNSASGNDSAFDGDADIAYGLLLADKQWGSSGEINYLAEAKTMITAIMESTIGPSTKVPLLGDWVDPAGEKYNQYVTRSSDFLPTHFRAFGRISGNSSWYEVVDKTQRLITSLQTNYSPETGLLPDFIILSSPSDHTPYPAPPNLLEADYDGFYNYNAGRDPWRIGSDALVNNDSISRLQASKMAQWTKRVTGGDPRKIKAGYKLDGAPIPGRDYFSTFYVAPFGVAAMMDPSLQSWLNAIYDAVKATHLDYYDDSVNLLCLLVMTGNYWDPTTVDKK